MSATVVTKELKISSRTQLNREQRGMTVETAPKTNRVVKAAGGQSVRTAEAHAGLEVVQAGGGGGGGGGSDGNYKHK